MAQILCAVTTCRFNGHRVCTLSGIQVGPSLVGSSPMVLGSTAAAYDGQLRAGYASEFEDYAAYARTVTETTVQGAACLSYSPL